MIQCPIPELCTHVTWLYPQLIENIVRDEWYAQCKCDWVPNDRSIEFTSTNGIQQLTHFTEPKKEVESMTTAAQTSSGIQKRGINYVTFGSIQRFNNNPSHQKIKPPFASHFHGATPTVYDVCEFFSPIIRAVMRSEIEKLRYRVSRACHSLWNVSTNISVRSGWIWNCEQKT
jgi:hypothetical protein